jgi:hypothetical protein
VTPGLVRVKPSSFLSLPAKINLASEMISIPFEPHAPLKFVKFEGVLLSLKIDFLKDTNLSSRYVFQKDD